MDFRLSVSRVRNDIVLKTLFFSFLCNEDEFASINQKVFQQFHDTDGSLSDQIRENMEGLQRQTEQVAHMEETLNARLEQYKSTIQEDIALQLQAGFEKYDLELQSNLSSWKKNYEDELKHFEKKLEAITTQISNGTSEAVGQSSDNRLENSNIEDSMQALEIKLGEKKKHLDNRGTCDPAYKEMSKRLSGVEAALASYPEAAAINSQLGNIQKWIQSLELQRQQMQQQISGHKEGLQQMVSGAVQAALSQSLRDSVSQVQKLAGENQRLTTLVTQQTVLIEKLQKDVGRLQEQRTMTESPARPMEGSQTVTVDSAGERAVMRAPAEIKSMSSKQGIDSTEVSMLQTAPVKQPKAESEIRAGGSNAALSRIKPFFLPDNKQAFLVGKSGEIKKKMRSVLEVQELLDFLQSSDHPKKNIFLRYIERHREEAERHLPKVDLSDYDDEELSEAATDIYFGWFEVHILGKTMVSIYRGLKTGEAFYRRLLTLLNRYLIHCGIYTREVIPGHPMTDADYQDMSPTVRGTKLKKNQDVIAEVERLPYYIHFLSRHNELEQRFYQGNLYVYAYEEGN